VWNRDYKVIQQDRFSNVGAGPKTVTLGRNHCYEAQRLQPKLESPGITVQRTALSFQLGDNDSN